MLITYINKYSFVLNGAKEVRPDRKKMPYMPDDCAKPPLNVPILLIFYGITTAKNLTKTWRKLTLISTRD
jgi:hypothetical protein